PDWTRAPSLWVAAAQDPPGSVNKSTTRQGIVSPMLVSPCPAAKAMIRNLVQGQEAVVRTARKVFPLAEKAGDEATCDLLTQRLNVHEKTAWMLRSLLE
ncbi:MAG: DNA starvation/stationary phase protection protein, partial [Alphaproteobacteria bacterium]|nr:DNA starvation/stationary phase protection protein [Alphaproteobacteria bacterium]